MAYVLPDFLYAGTGKAGSTWLFEALSEHPDVFMTKVKETNFFDLNFDRGVDWYAQFFAGASATRPVGEIAHRYLRDPETAGRILRTLGPIKILVNLREPTEYLVSDYRFVRRNGQTDLSLDDYAARQFDWASLDYRSMLTPYVELFGVDLVLVSDFATLERDPQHYLDGVTDFLGVSRYALGESGRRRSNPARSARFPVAARAANRGSKWLKRRGGQRVVQSAKHSQLLQNLLFKPAGAKPEVSTELVDRVRAEADPSLSWIDETFDLRLRASWYGSS